MEGRDMKRLSILATLGLAVLVLPSPAARADSDDKGSLSASFETNTTYYFNDEGTGATAPDGRFGSNNYLKLDYAKGGFTAGVQLEGYLPAVSGYFSGTLAAENFLSYDIYAGFAANGWDIRVGSLYEQFGSGLLFRTYEDRELGINNALQGVRVAYTFGDYLSVRGLYGRVRNVREYSDAMVSGADLSFSLSRLLDMEKFDIVLEGSVIDKYEAQPSNADASWSSHSPGYSGRLLLGYEGFQLKGEYMDRRSDPAFYNSLNNGRSKAIQVDLSYTGNGFGGLVTFRKLDNPFFQGIRSESGMYTYINYVPALTQQHTYMLATLNPYSAHSDEIGGQADLYYNFRRGTALGGKKGMKIHANFSNYFNSGYEADNLIDKLLFRDLTIDIERWFGSDFKLILLYSWQTYNELTQMNGTDILTSHALVADMTYKINRKNSVRLELQHLFGSPEDHGNWAAALLEYNFAPRWSFAVQDMWNYGDTGLHYPSGSISYSYGKVRCAINAGRFKEGYLCSGGVCRMTPAYTGINLSLIATL